ncbi:MAG TPA: alpha/beta hydrolase [Anaerolineales bacterium]|nr:alpha/beta hydrolase [Anaerolineales bacterium]
MTPKTHTLNDGRRLGYAEFGNPSGKPMFYFSGGTTSGLFAQAFHHHATQADARIIAADRPGIGISDFKPQRSLLDWPQDVCELADALNLERFAVVSESGGSPYAAACALKIPGRLTAAGIVAGVSPFDAPGVLQEMPAQNRLSVTLVRKIPMWLMRLIYQPTVAAARRNPEKLRLQLLQSAKWMPEVDRAIFVMPEIQQALLEAFCAAFQQGARGPLEDLKLCAGSWGKWLMDIPIEVRLWHGEADMNAPIAMARYMQHAIPKSRATCYPGEGHVSVMYKYGCEILGSLTLQ